MSEQDALAARLLIMDLLDHPNDEQVKLRARQFLDAWTRLRERKI